MINKTRGVFSRKGADPNISRVVSCRVSPETLKALRMMAAHRDLTVCAMMTQEAERLAATWEGQFFARQGTDKEQAA